jgi:polypeptide N-acetylgalactosaminyltransferase
MNEESSMCIDTMGKKAGQPVGAGPCHGIGGNQAWSFTKNGEIRSDELCISTRSMSLGRDLQLEKCSTTTPNVKHVFKYDKEVSLDGKRGDGFMLTCSQRLRLEVKD